MKEPVTNNGKNVLKEKMCDMTKCKQDMETTHGDTVKSSLSRFQGGKRNPVVKMFLRDVADDKDNKTQDDQENTNQSSDENNATIQDFAQKASISGMKYVGDKRSRIPRRCFWLLVVLTGAGVLIYQIVRCVSLYVTYPVSVDVNIRYAKDLPFPAVTICNMNLLRRKELENKEGQDITDILRLLYPLVTEEVTNESILENFTFDSVSNLTELVYRYGHQKDDMIILCKWKGKFCSTANFTTSITDFGLCHTFNSGTNGRPQLRVDNTGFPFLATGSRFALSLIVNIEHDQYGRGPRESAGLKIAIHNPNDLPMVGDLGFAVPPGSHTLVGLKMTQVSSKPAPYGTCMSKKLEYYKDYTMSKCQIECLTKYIVSKCGCKTTYMPVAAEAPLCSAELTFHCYLPHLDNYASQRDYCNCPVPCERFLYTSGLSYAQFPSNFATVEYSKLLNKSDPDFLRKNAIKLDIFFEELSYEEISQHIDYELFKLFSDIGGSMGLLLGASFVTLVEIADFACVHLYKKWRKQTTTKVSPVDCVR
ncbi:acid-sensing ion channel 2-like [Glandiceps talaboti]